MLRYFVHSLKCFTHCLVSGKIFVLAATTQPIALFSPYNFLLFFVWRELQTKVASQPNQAKKRVSIVIPRHVVLGVKLSFFFFYYTCSIATAASSLVRWALSQRTYGRRAQEKICLSFFSFTLSTTLSLLLKELSELWSYCKVHVTSLKV